MGNVLGHTTVQECGWQIIINSWTCLVFLSYMYTCSTSLAYLSRSYSLTGSLRTKNQKNFLAVRKILPVWFIAYRWKNNNFLPDGQTKQPKTSQFTWCLANNEIPWEGSQLEIMHMNLLEEGLWMRSIYSVCSLLQFWGSELSYMCLLYCYM